MQIEYVQWDRNDLVLMLRAKDAIFSKALVRWNRGERPTLLEVKIEDHWYLAENAPDAAEVWRERIGEMYCSAGSVADMVSTD